MIENQNNDKPRTIEIRLDAGSLLRFFTSMWFSIFLLLIIIGACIAGSIVSSPKEYFRSPWMIAIAAILCLNLAMCSVRRFPVAVAKYRKATKHKIGAFGTWLCHMGMILVIVGFILGDFLSKEYVVYGTPGSIQPVGDTGLMLSIDAFDVKLRDDFTVDQYVATLSVTDENGSVLTGEASVNHPMSAFGYEWYQDSTGWANFIDIYKDGEPMRTDIVCVGEYTYPDDRPELKLLLNKFYPDLAKAADGSFYSETPLLKNPHSLFSIYYNGQVKGMDMTEMNVPVQVNEYTFVLRDPTEYTLIVVKNDPASVFVGVAALMMLAGIFMAFYWRPEFGSKGAAAAGGGAKAAAEGSGAEIGGGSVLTKEAGAPDSEKEVDEE